jgi:hypothetical protein
MTTISLIPLIPIEKKTTFQKSQNLEFNKHMESIKGENIVDDQSPQLVEKQIDDQVYRANQRATTINNNALFRLEESYIVLIALRDKFKAILEIQNQTNSVIDKRADNINIYRNLWRNTSDLIRFIDEGTQHHVMDSLEELIETISQVKSTIDTLAKINELDFSSYLKNKFYPNLLSVINNIIVICGQHDHSILLQQKITLVDKLYKTVIPRNYRPGTPDDEYSALFDIKQHLLIVYTEKNYDYYNAKEILTLISRQEIAIDLPNKMVSKLIRLIEIFLFDLNRRNSLYNDMMAHSQDINIIKENLEVRLDSRVNDI